MSMEGSGGSPQGGNRSWTNEEQFITTKRGRQTTTGRRMTINIHVPDEVEALYYATKVR